LVAAAMRTGAVSCLKSAAIPEPQPDRGQGQLLAYRVGPLRRREQRHIDAKVNETTTVDMIHTLPAYG
jgi:hypothetical protein